MSLWQETSTVPLDLSGMQHPRAITMVECLSRAGQQRDECVSIFLLCFFLCFHLPFCFSPLGLVHHPMESQHTSFSLSLSDWLTDWDLRLLSAQLCCNICNPPNLHPVTLDILYPLLTVHMVQSGHNLGHCNPVMLHWSSPKEGSTGSLIHTTGQLMLLVAQTHIRMIDSHYSAIQGNLKINTKEV